MMSAAMHHKLKSVVDSWQREEKGKAEVLSQAGYSLLVLAGGTGLSAFFLPIAWPWALAIGFAAWVAYVMWLVHEHLG
jgi:hypothetical protein